jgi:hypothetical protein
MADWRLKIITAEAQRLIELASEDTQLREQLRALARTILDSTANPPNRDEVEPGRSTGSDPTAAAIPEPSRPSERPVEEARPAREPLRELTLGRSTTARKLVSSPPTTGAMPRGSEAELAPIEARCRLKAEAARRAALRLHQACRGEAPTEEVAPGHPEIAEWAERWTDAFYWRYASEEAPPLDPSILDQLGGCFEAVAEALALAIGCPDQPKILEQVLPLIAEAQSALRTAAQQIQTNDEPEQLQVFEWLKVTAARRRIYIRRFMRAGDSADPARWAELLDRVQQVGERAGYQTRKRTQLEALFQRLRAGVSALPGGGATEADWRTVIAAVEDILREGVPPSRREIRELLLPVVNDLPELEDLPAGFQRVLREIDRFLATHTAAEEPAAPPAPATEVLEAARLLGGRSIVLIGGNRRREAQESLRQALGLKEVIWLETKEHEAVAGFEPIVARPDVALVLLAIRWASHGFGDVKPLCDRHGKLLVRLPGGYNANQVAAQILAQCSGQLAKSV